MQYLDFNNQYRMALSQPSPYAGFEYVEDVSMFKHDFIKSFDKLSDFDHSLLADVDYPKNLRPLYKDLPFLTEKIVINNDKKLACTFQNKTNYRFYS